MHLGGGGGGGGGGGRDIECVVLICLFISLNCSFLIIIYCANKQ